MLELGLAFGQLVLIARDFGRVQKLLGAEAELALHGDEHALDQAGQRGGALVFIELGPLAQLGQLAGFDHGPDQPVIEQHRGRQLVPGSLGHVELVQNAEEIAKQRLGMGNEPVQPLFGFAQR